MPGDESFECHVCGVRHPGPPLSYGLDAPAYWAPELADDPDNLLEQELCIIKGQGFFVRGLIEIPVLDTGDVFDWTVWVSLSETNFARALDLWDQPGRENEPPYFGWLSSQLPYPVETLSLKTHVHTREVGRRPLVEVEHTGHPLAVEQQHGITQARVREIAAAVLHQQ